MNSTKCENLSFTGKECSNEAKYLVRRLTKVKAGWNKSKTIQQYKKEWRALSVCDDCKYEEDIILEWYKKRYIKNADDNTNDLEYFKD